MGENGLQTGKLGVARITGPGQIKHQLLEAGEPKSNQN